MPYMPVVILHESLDGEFLFAVFDSFAGWVRKDAVAICSSKEDWTAKQSGDDWLTGTFVAPAPGPEDKIHPDSVIINGMNVRRANLKTWLESAQTALTVKSA